MRKGDKRIFLLFTAVLLAGVLSGCAEKEQETEAVASDFLHYPYSQEAAADRIYDISAEEALIAVSTAYLQKGVLIQYDQAWTTRVNNDFPARAARWNRTAAPELATSQYTVYTDCSKFQNAIYYNTFQYELPAESTDTMLDYPELQVMYYEPSWEETEEEKTQIFEQLENLLQVGDLINYRLADDNNGHILMYTGDGEFIHATSGDTGGDYQYTSNNGGATKVDVTEPTGAVGKISLKTLETSTESRYLLAQLKFGVLRPMMELSKEDITGDAYCRTAFMQGIISEVTSDVPGGQSIEPGAEVNYTVTFQNLDSVARNVHVDLAAAEHTAITKEPESFDLEIPANSTATLTFAVQIDEDPALLGTEISGPGVKANGMTVATTGHLVQKNLKDSLATAFETFDFTAAGVRNDYSMAAAAYREIAGYELPFASTEELLWKVFVRDDYNNIALSLRSEGVIPDMVVKGYYGGMAVKNAEGDPGERVSNFTGASLRAGDILVVSEDLTPEHTYLYLCTGPYNLAGWFEEYGEVSILRSGYLAPIMESMLGQYAFALLRPSFVMEETPEETVLGEADTSDYTDTVIITGEPEWTGSTGKVEVLSVTTGESRVVAVEDPSSVASERLCRITVENGYARFASAASGGIYDGTGLRAGMVEKGAAIGLTEGTLSYESDQGTASVAVNEDTKIFLVSNENDYGRLSNPEPADTVVAAAVSENGNKAWNLLFEADEAGTCKWVIVEKNGLDISRCVGLPRPLY